MPAAARRTSAVTSSGGSRRPRRAPARPGNEGVCRQQRASRRLHAASACAGARDGGLLQVREPRQRAAAASAYGASVPRAAHTAPARRPASGKAGPRRAAARYQGPSATGWSRARREVRPPAWSASRTTTAASGPRPGRRPCFETSSRASGPGRRRPSASSRSASVHLRVRVAGVPEVSTTKCATRASHRPASALQAGLRGHVPIRRARSRPLHLGRRRSRPAGQRRCRPSPPTARRPSPARAAASAARASPPPARARYGWMASRPRAPPAPRTRSPSACDRWRRREDGRTERLHHVREGRASRDHGVCDAVEVDGGEAGRFQAAQHVRLAGRAAVQADAEQPSKSTTPLRTLARPAPCSS
jgi:hypothetical protein